MHGLPFVHKELSNSKMVAHRTQVMDVLCIEKQGYLQDLWLGMLSGVPYKIWTEIAENVWNLAYIAK